MITKEYVNNYVSKRNEIETEYRKKLNDLDGGYKLAISDGINIQLGDVIKVKAPEDESNVGGYREEMITRLDINTGGSIHVYTVPKRKVDGKWSKRPHYVMTINAYETDKITVLRHESYIPKID